MRGSHWEFVASLIRPHRRAFVLYGLIVAVATALPIIGSLMIARFVELVVNGAPLREVAPLGLGYAGIGLVSAAFGVLVTWRSTELAWRVTNGLRQDLASHVLEADLAFHRDRTPGELLTRCDADVTSLTTFLAAVVARIIGIALLAVASAAVLLVVEPRMSPVLIIGYTILGWTMWRVRDLSAEAVIKERTLDAESNSIIEQYLAGAEDVAALGAGAHGLRRFGEPVARMVVAAGERVRYEMRVQGSIKSVIAMVMVAVLVVGGIGLSAGWVGVAGVVLAYRLVDIVRHPVEHLTWRLQEAQGVAGAARRIIELVDERSSIVSGTAVLPDGPLDVRFDSVSLVYDDSTDGAAAIDSLDLHLEAGKVLGLVGRTGSGKTTIARLVLRLVQPTGGRLSIGGVDVTTLADDPFRTRVVAIPQDVQLFPGTVRDNVAMFAPVDDDAVTAALRDAGLGRWLDDLADGLDTVLSADGRTSNDNESDADPAVDGDTETDAAPLPPLPPEAHIHSAEYGDPEAVDGPSGTGTVAVARPRARTGMSAGQAQLLAIARALLRRPHVIVLDEATSRVDPVTQAAISSALARLVEGRTAVIIAHRLETLDVCDRIAVLADGAVVEIGDREALAADGGSRYAQLRAVGDDAEELA